MPKIKSAIHFQKIKEEEKADDGDVESPGDEREDTECGETAGIEGESCDNEMEHTALINGEERSKGVVYRVRYN